jgi:hypothetical protein
MRAPGERLRQAVLRLAEERAARPEEPVSRLVDEVARRFDLDVADSEWLLRAALEGHGAQPPGPAGRP